MNDVPSPARPAPANRLAQPRKRGEEGPTALPWHTALYASVRNLEAELDACRKENAELLVTVSQLNVRLRKARAWATDSNEKWRIRRAAWTAERAELLRRLEGRIF